MKNRLTLALVFVVIIIAGWWYAFKNQADGNEQIKIAFLAPLTGDTAVFGENEKKGLDLAVEQINKSGGIYGRQIEIVVEDTQCDPQLGTNAAQKVITVDKVIAIIGDTCSSSVLAMAPIVTKAKVPLITPAAGSDVISGTSPYVFRNFIANSKYAAFAASYITDTLKSEQVAILYINNAFGQNFSSDFVQSFSGKVVYNEGYDPATKDFRSLLAKLKSTSPEIVYLAGYYNDGALILKQAKDIGVKVQFFGSSDAYDDPQFIALAGTNVADGFTYFTIPTVTGPAHESFTTAFVARYKQDPPIYSDYTYDTMYILAEAMKSIPKSSLTGEAIKDALHKVEFAGASGVVKFNDKNDIASPVIIIKKIEDGKSVVF